MSNPGFRSAVATLAVTATAAIIVIPPTPPLAGAAPAAAESSCAAISPASFSGLTSDIRESLRHAEADVRANGTSGKYAVAATNNRDLLVRAQNRVEEARSFLQSNSPSSTNYAEGGKVKEYLRTTIPWLTDAAHWATVSASWHRSADARASFERTVTALEKARGLYGASGSCFLSNYF